MTISDVGWCPSCRRNILDHPQLQCPWCHSVSPVHARKELALPPTATIPETLRAATDHILSLEAAIRSAKTLRSVTARQALSGDLPAIAAEAHCRVTSIEKWAVGGVGPKCRKGGHLRSEHAELVDGRWICRECERLRPARQKGQPKPGPQRVRNAWAAHERRMAERERLATAGQLPPKLNASLPPPVPSTTKRVSATD